MDYKIIFQEAVIKLTDYVLDNNIKSLVLGISGGIDSTICAAIASEVAKATNIKLYGRSLPIKNKDCENIVAEIVGNAFCDDFDIIDIENIYETVNTAFSQNEMFVQSLIASGNIQARLRMIYLYNLAGISKGIVLDTDNLTEHYLGFFTLHGDVGDYKPIGHLWKTDVYGLANYLINEFYLGCRKGQIRALTHAISLTPTDGLGITNSDLDQIGTDSYETVDLILKAYLNGSEYPNVSDDVINSIIDRYTKTKFKR